MEDANVTFFRAAEETFGDKININSLNTDEKSAKILGLSKDKIESYPKMAWVPSNKCPSCDSDLLGWTGSFQWGIVHGQGFCSSCKKASFQYYHYIDDRRFEAMALIGF